MSRYALPTCALLLLFAATGLHADALQEAYKLEGTGAYDKARREYAALAAKETAPGPATLRLVRLLRLVGKYEEAGKRLAPAIAAKGKTAAPFLVEAAELAVETGRHDEARKLFEAALASDPALIDPQAGLGLLDLELGRHKPGLERLMKLFDAYDPNEREYSSRELTYLSMGFRALAMRSDQVDRTDTLDTIINRMLPAATKADQYNHTARWVRGEILLDAFQPEAKKNFTDALKINPRHPWLRIGLGLVHAQRYSTLKQAPEQFHRALKVNPRSAQAHEALASLYLADELYDQALPRIEKALATNPRRLSTLALKAGYHLLRGEQADYEKLERQVLAINPKYGELYHICANVLEAKRQYEQGAALCRKAIELDPKLWHAWIALGSNLLRIGQEEQAKKALLVVKKEFFFHVQSRNYLVLLEGYNEFIVKSTPHFRIRLHVSENAVMRELAGSFMEQAYTTLTRRYGFEPQGPILFEMFNKHDDFTVRTIGLTGLGALGACFGKVVTMDSPKAFGRPFNWATTAWHEFAHVVTLQLSGMRVPRWFTEGLSEYEEYVRNPSNVRQMHGALYSAWTRGALRGIRTFNAGFSRPKYPNEVGVCYFQGGLICRYIAETFGFPAIPKMLRLFAKGHKTPEVISLALGLSLDEFDKQTLAYFKKHVFDKIHVLPSFSEAQLEELKDLLEEQPANLELREKLALAYFSRGMASDAELRAGQVLKGNPKSARANLVLGRINNARKNLPLAKQHFEAALKLGARDFHAHLLLGHIYKNQDNNEEMALEQWGKAKACNPFYVGAGSPYRLLAAAYQKAGKLDRWADELGQIVAQSGTGVKERMELVAYHEEKKNYEKVVGYLREVIDVDPFVAEAEIKLGRNLLLLKKHAEALVPLQVALQLKPKNQMHRVYTGLGEAYHGLGQPAKARIMVREALALKPDYARAKRLLQQLER